MSYKIIEEYRRIHVPEIGLASNDEKYFWFRLISEEFINNPKINIIKNNIEIESELSLSDDNSDYSDYDISYISSEDDEIPDKIYKYALFNLDEEKLKICLDFFKYKKKLLENRYVGCMLEVKYDANLDILFDGEFKIITNNDFSNFFEPKITKNIDINQNVSFSPLYDIAKPELN